MAAAGDDGTARTLRDLWQPSHPFPLFPVLAETGECAVRPCDGPRGGESDSYYHARLSPALSSMRSYASHQSAGAPWRPGKQRSATASREKPSQGISTSNRRRRMETWPGSEISESSA